MTDFTFCDKKIGEIFRFSDLHKHLIVYLSILTDRKCYFP